MLYSLHRLAYGLPYDAIDDQCRMSPQTQRKAFRAFLLAIHNRYGPQRLNRAPKSAELMCIESKFSAKGLPGCIGTIDCMQMLWKTCPKAFKGQYHNPKNGRKSSIVIKAICDSELYCWNVFLGRPGTKNN